MGKEMPCFHDLLMLFCLDIDENLIAHHGCNWKPIESVIREATVSID